MLVQRRPAASEWLCQVAGCRCCIHTDALSGKCVGYTTRDSATQCGVLTAVCAVLEVDYAADSLLLAAVLGRLGCFVAECQPKRTSPQCYAWRSQRGACVWSGCRPALPNLRSVSRVTHPPLTACSARLLMHSCCQGLTWPLDGTAARTRQLRTGGRRRWSTCHPCWPSKPSTLQTALLSSFRR